MKTLALSVISHYYHLVFIASVTSVFVGWAVPNITLYSLELSIVGQIDCLYLTD